MIEAAELPARLTEMFTDSSFPTGLSIDEVAELLNLPAERRRDFRLHGAEEATVHTQQVVEFARSGGGLNPIYKTWSSAAQQTAPEDYLDAERAFVLGGTLGYEDLLVLDFSSTPPCVRYFLDEDGRDDWTRVSASIDDFVDAVMEAD